MKKHFVAGTFLVVFLSLSACTGIGSRNVSQNECAPGFTWVTCDYTTKCSMMCGSKSRTSTVTTCEASATIAKMNLTNTLNTMGESIQYIDCIDTGSPWRGGTKPDAFNPPIEPQDFGDQSCATCLQTYCNVEADSCATDSVCLCQAQAILDFKDPVSTCGQGNSITSAINSCLNESCMPICQKPTKPSDCPIECMP